MSEQSTELNPWERAKEMDLLERFGFINHIIGRAEADAADITDLVEEGCDPTWGEATVTVSGLEKPMISAALHLVGFFSDTLGEIANGFMQKLLAENDKALDTVTEEQQATIDTAYDRIHAKREQAFMAALGASFGLEDDEPTEEPAA